MAATDSSVLALDVGAKRVGLAVTSLAARLPRPLTTLPHDEKLWDEIAKIIAAEGVSDIVVGLPRGMEGQETGQTGEVRDFAAGLEQRFSLPVHLQDEAVTSHKAEAELEARGKPYGREDIDALAATYILEDWLSQNQVK